MDEIFEQIARQRENMSKTHKKLADYILENRSTVPFLNISNLARLSGASEASIVRFCTQLGFSGYPDFKKALQATVEKRLSIRERLQISGDAYDDDNHTFVANIFKDDINSISATLEGLNMDTFFSVMDELQRAKHIVISANRSALSLGVFLEYYLRMILGDAVLLSQIPIIMEDEIIARFDENTAVIGITFYRYTKSTVHLMEYAHKRGCVTIALTDTLRSPVVPFAKYSLFAETRLPSLSETYAGPLSIVNAMIIYLSKVHRAQLDEKLQTLEKRWADFDVFDE